jgi:MFS family permease
MDLLLLLWLGRIAVHHVGVHEFRRVGGVAVSRSSRSLERSSRDLWSESADRFILGAFEASIAPSMLIIVSMWWTRREQPLRNNIWYSANGMATILGSLLSYGLAHAHTKLYSYQLIFLICGVIAVVLSIPTMLILPRHPTRARWLTDEQKYIALERIRLNNTGTQNQHFKWTQVRECFTDPKSWMWVIMSESARCRWLRCADGVVFCISLVSGGIGAFGREW